jgi:hypothetical protein
MLWASQKIRPNDGSKTALGAAGRFGQSFCRLLAFIQSNVTCSLVALLQLVDRQACCKVTFIDGVLRESQFGPSLSAVLQRAKARRLSS